MRKHPSDVELVRAALADSQDGEARATRAHLDAGCERCSSRVKELTAIIAALDAPALAETPTELNAKAAAWLAAQERAPSRTVIDRAAETLREIRAVLVLDSWSDTLLEGIRGAAAARGRQLLYESPAGDLHLQIEPAAAGGVTVQGQFLPPESGADLASGRAVLEREPRDELCRLTPNGEFRFSASGADELSLHIEWNGQRILVDPITVTGK